MKIENIPSVSRTTILKDIMDEFQMIYQEQYSVDVSKHWYRAEVLVELLEVEDCGSVGGYDGNNPSVVSEQGLGYSPKQRTGYDIFDRFQMVAGKYPKLKIPKSVCAHDLNFYRDYFTRLNKYGVNLVSDA